KEKCRKGQVRIKGKWRANNTLTGRVTAKGLAGVALKLTVKASKEVKAALRKGRTVRLGDETDGAPSGAPSFVPVTRACTALPGHLCGRKRGGTRAFARRRAHGGNPLPA